MRAARSCGAATTPECRSRRCRFVSAIAQFVHDARCGFEFRGSAFGQLESQLLRGNASLFDVTLKCSVELAVDHVRRNDVQADLERRTRAKKGTDIFGNPLKREARQLADQVIRLGDRDEDGG